MAWIEAHDSLPDHPKTVKSADVLGIDKDTLVGKLLRLWTWALDSRKSGFIPDYDMQTVAERMRWTKSPQKLFDGLCAIPGDEGYGCGFLGKAEGGYIIHDWEDYTHRYYAQEAAREKDRKRKRGQKEFPRKSAGNSSNIPAEFQRKSDGDSNGIPTEFQRNGSGNSDGIPSEESRNSISYRNPNRNLTVTPTTTTMRAREDSPPGEPLPLDLTPEELAEQTDTLACVREACKRVGVPIDALADEEKAIDACFEYSLPWVLQAIERTGSRATDKRSWGYILGILKRWKKGGGPDDGARPEGAGASQDGSGGGGAGTGSYRVPGTRRV